MRISSIKLENFRNFTSQEIDFGPDINVLYGNNAQGKTNILEAIYLGACARSHRTGKDKDLIRHQADSYQVTIDYIHDNGSKNELTINYLGEIQTSDLKRKSTRTIAHNGLKLDRIGDLMGLFHAVIFAPEDLMLVKDGPAVRRRFLDLIISQLRPSYFQDLQQFSRLLQQRNRLLKLLRDQSNFGKLDDFRLNELDIWTLKYAEKAAALILRRFDYAARIGAKANRYLSSISSGKEELNITYKTFSALSPDNSLDELSNLLYDKLKGMFNEDILKGNTSIGPHRDDLDLKLDGQQLRLYASQGQQRSVVLAMKLAELHLIKEEINEYPILLLDDVMSELDENRRRCLLENIVGAQIFVTCTDRDHLVADMDLGCQIDTYLRDDFSQVKEDHNLEPREFNFFKVRSGRVEYVE